MTLRGHRPVDQGAVGARSVARGTVSVRADRMAPSRHRTGRPLMAGAHEGAGFPARGIAYLDKRYVPMEDATISIATHAFNYGTGCFEGIRGYWNAEREEIYIVRLEDHFRRMQRSCH